MTTSHQWLHVIVLGIVLLCWVALGCAFFLRKRPPRAPEVGRDRMWILGLLVQGVSVGMVWTVRRPMFTPMAPLGAPFEIGLALLAVALAVGAVWVLVAAERALGRQFAYQARLVEGHKLITEGPYRRVRHPMYSSLFGLTLATAVAYSHWMVLPPFVIVYAVGTALRIRSEERLLRKAFGPEFESYARRVPAVIPRLR